MHHILVKYLRLPLCNADDVSHSQNVRYEDVSLGLTQSEMCCGNTRSTATDVLFLSKNENFGGLDMASK